LMTLTKNWYDCVINQNWPVSVTWSVSNISWNCIINKCVFWSGSWYLDCVLF
jgi:hypothetical protein